MDSMSMNLFEIAAEVPGNLGPTTVITNHADLKSGRAIRMRISELEFVFDDWLGDDIVESHPVYLVTPDMAKRLARFSGLSLAGARLTKSQTFVDIRGLVDLPAFVWLRPGGEAVVDTRVVRSWSGHDICASQTGRLLVTEPVLRTLRSGHFEYGTASELSLVD